MKTVGKMVLTLVAMLTMVATASAATDKLIVKDSGNNAVFKVQDNGFTQVSGTISSTVGVGKDAVGATINPTLVAGITSDWLYGLKISPTINANGFTNPLLYAFYIPGSHDGIIRLKFDNTSAGVNAQAGIEMNNNAGQGLITFYGSNYTTASLRNVMYYKNAVGGMKFLGATGSSIGFGIGTAAANANAITVDSLNRVNLGNVPGPYADNATATANGLTVGTLYRTSTGVLMVTY